MCITDYFSHFAQAIPTKHQMAKTTAKALNEHFFLYFGFPAKLHNDIDAYFESKGIRKLGIIAGDGKTRTTPYHSTGNWIVTTKLGEIERGTEE